MLTVDNEASEEWVIVNFLMLYSSLFSTMQIQYSFVVLLTT